MATVARFSSPIPRIDLRDLAPQIGDDIEFIEDTTEVFRLLTLLSDATGDYADAMNRLGLVLSAIADMTTSPKVVSANGATRDSAAYSLAIDAVPITEVDLALPRKLLVTDVVPIVDDANDATSDWCIAQQTASGPRWSGRILFGQT